MEKEKVLPIIGGSCGDIDGMSVMEVLKHANGENLKAFQFFNGNPGYYNRRKLDRASAIEALNFMAKTGLRAFAHCPFCINLCRDARDDIKSLKSVVSDVNEMGQAGISAVTHIGHHLNKFTVQTVCQNLAAVNFFGDDANFKPLLLENAAGDGTECGVSFEELQFLAQNTHHRVGFCIDTQHSFSGLKPDFQTVDGVNEFLKTLDRTIGLQRVKLFHLNDSKWNPDMPKGKKDAHECLCQGYIWGRDTKHRAGLKHLLYRGAELGIPFVTETSSSDPAFLYDLLLRDK